MSLSSIDKDNNYSNFDNIQKTLDFSHVPVDSLTQIKELIGILEDKEMLKIVLVFCIKGFTWYRELNKYFNISGDDKEWTNQKIATVLDKLASLGFIINTHYTHLDDDVIQEYLVSSMGNDFTRWLNPSGKVYVITPEGVMWGNHIKDYVANLIFSNRSFLNSYKAVLRVTKSYTKFIDKIEHEEITMLQREMRSPFENIKFVKSTKLARTMKLAVSELKKDFLQKKENHGLLTNEEKNQLALINEKDFQIALIDPDIVKFKQTQRAITTHNGQSINESHMWEELAQRDKEMEEAQTIIGKPELATQPSIWDKGMYLSKKAREEWIDEEKPKTAEQEVDDLFSSMGLN